MQSLGSDKVDRVFWAIHREELKKQAIAAFTGLGITPVVWDADNKPSVWGDVNIIMIPSAREISNTCKDEKNLLIVDEGHHKDAPTWEALVEQLNCTKVCYLTATPSEILDDKIPIYKKPYKELADEGYLVPPIYERVLTRINYPLNTRGGDFTHKSLSKLNSKERNDIVTKRYNDYKKKYGKTLVFVASIAHAETLHKQLSKGNKNVSIITSRTKNRDEVLEDYENLASNEPSVLITVGIFVEGVDVPSVKTIFICRPTISSVLYVQMIGRGSRICEGKDKYYVVDFVDAVKNYEVRSAEMLCEAVGTDYVDQEVKDLLTRDEKKDFLKKYLKKTPKVLGMEPEQLDDLIGLAMWTNKFAKRQRVVPVYSEDLEYLSATHSALFNALNRNFPIKEVIHSTWGDIGVESSLTFKQWKEMAWSIVGEFQNDPKAKFKIKILDSYPTPDKSKFRTYFEIAKANIEINAELNKEYASQTDKLFQFMLQVLTNRQYTKEAAFAIDLHMTPIGYRDRVFTVRATNMCRYPQKNPNDHTPCLSNLVIWKRHLNTALRIALEDPKAEIALTFQH